MAATDTDPLFSHCDICLSPLDTHPAQGCSCGWPDCTERALFLVGTRVRGLLVPRCERHCRAALATAERYGMVVVAQALGRWQPPLPL